MRNDCCFFFVTITSLRGEINENVLLKSYHIAYKWRSVLTGNIYGKFGNAIWCFYAWCIFLRHVFSALSVCSLGSFIFACVLRSPFFSSGGKMYCFSAAVCWKMPQLYTYVCENDIRINQYLQWKWNYALY